MAGFGEKLPPAPLSLKLIDAPTTFAPAESFARITMGSGRVVPTVPVCLAPETTWSTVTEEVAVSVKVAEL